MRDRQVQPPGQQIPIAPDKFLRMTTISYAVMALVGFEISWWWHQNTLALFLGPVKNPQNALMIVACALCFLVAAQKALEDLVPSYRKFRDTLARILGRFSWPQSVWLAFCSSAGEEILFRGAIQPFLGVWVTSFLFGALHLDPADGISTWTIWAVVAGLILGASVNITGSIWPAIAIHFLVNLIGIRSLARQLNKKKAA